MGAPTAAAFHLLSPIATVVSDGTPTFRWTPLPGATAYTVTVQGQTDVATISSPPVMSTEWTPAEQLVRGHRRDRQRHDRDLNRRPHRKDLDHREGRGWHDHEHRDHRADQEPGPARKIAQVREDRLQSEAEDRQHGLQREHDQLRDCHDATEPCGMAHIGGTRRRGSTDSAADCPCVRAHSGDRRDGAPGASGNSRTSAGEFRARPGAAGGRGLRATSCWSGRTRSSASSAVRSRSPSADRQGDTGRVSCTRAPRRIARRRTDRRRFGPWQPPTDSYGIRISSPPSQACPKPA